jgi:tetratricopeptide (TPR) repeat protein
VELTGLEPRRSDLARGIVIARAARPLDPAEQRALWAALGAAGVTEPSEVESDKAEEPQRQWLAAPWLPPSPTEVDPQRLALEAAAERHGLEAVWCVKVETGIDGIAWLEMSQAAPEEDAAERAETEASGEVVDGIFEDGAEVLYAAPDAPQTPDPAETTVAEEDEGEALAEIEVEGMIESYWRNGAPPMEHAVAFPIERYPDVIDDYDWERFGVALKLSGPALAGEESVVNAFFALWLSVYQDERAEEFEPFQRADVIHDRTHRSALMWVERFAVPATASDQVHFLLWVIARLHDIIPLAWARFDTIDEAVKARAVVDDDGDEERQPFILAGNPFAERFRRHGEEGALAWAVAQSAWSRRELAGMLVEVALEHDPDDPATSAVAERLLRRALAFDAASEATGYLAIVLVRQRRIAEAIALAKGAADREVRMLVIGETAEHAPGELAGTFELLDQATIEATEASDIVDLIGTIARHAPAYLDAALALLPDDVALVPYLYNASFAVERPRALAILRRVLSLPEPAPGTGEARTAHVMAWNNACIHAHALGDYRLAAELADGGQPFAPENPYIYHSAACAYAAIGQIDRAIEQVARAIENNYEHTEKMETDGDLSPLRDDPRFGALFVEWRTRRADLN